MKTTSALIFSLALSLFTVNLGLATTLKCTVEEVDGEKVVLNCGESATKLETGMQVKVKTVKTTGAVEGC